METTNLFIPDKIKVGYQKRSDTYTKMLAYVIYYDNKGVLRKEKSWDGWRDHKIESSEFENVPTSGFVINKKVGGYKSDWNFRQAYCRIYDPRGFEFEISFENLLYILQECNSVKGKGLEGEFIYSWCGSDLVLLPVSSPDYQSCLDYTKLQDGKIYAKNIKVGHIYVDSSQNKWVYIGKYQYKEYVNTSYNLNDPISKEKKYIFLPLNNQYDSDLMHKYSSFNGLTKFKKEISDTFVDNISDLIQFYIESPHSSEFDHFEIGEITENLLEELKNSYDYRSIVKKYDTNFDVIYSMHRSWSDENKIYVKKPNDWDRTGYSVKDIIENFGLVIAVYKNNSKIELEY